MLLRAMFAPLVRLVVASSLLTLAACGGGGGAAEPTLTGITVTPATPSIAAGTSQQLTATATYSDSTHTDVTTAATWTSSATAAATIGAATGKAQAVAVGSSTLTATYQGQSGTTTLTVTAAVITSLEVTPATPSLAVGTSQTFTATAVLSDNTTQNVTSDVTWASSSPAAATITSGGVATAGAAGTTTITATCVIVACATDQGSTVFTVTPAALVSIAATPGTADIPVGLPQQYVATGTYSDHSTQTLTSQVTWSTDNAAVASISTTGLATPLAVGTAHVTANLGGIASPTASLTADGATLNSVTIAPTKSDVVIGSTLQFTAVGSYSDTSTFDITRYATWTSSAPALLSISNASGSSGLAKGIAAGASNVMVSFGSRTATATPIDVTASLLTSIVVSPANSYMALGSYRPYTAAGVFADGSTSDMTNFVTWSSDTVGAATVSNATGQQGSVYGVNQGNAQITAAFGSVLGSTSLSVLPTAYTFLVNDSTSQSGGEVTELANGIIGSPAFVGTNNPISARQSALNPSESVSIVVDPSGRYAFVANPPEALIYQFTISATGLLTPNGTTSTGSVGSSSPYALAMDPAGAYLYVADNLAGTVIQYAVGSAGALTATGHSVSFGGGSYGMAIDPTGKFLFLANVSAGTIQWYSIASSGFSGAGNITSGAGHAPYALVIDPSGRFLYAANHGDDTIAQFTIGAGGALTAMTPATVALTSGAGPVSIAIDPSSHFVYTANATGNSASRLSVADSGLLTSLSPDGSVGATPTVVAAEPNGGFLLVGSILTSSYVVESQQINADGTLVYIGSTIVDPIPREFGIVATVRLTSIAITPSASSVSHTGSTQLTAIGTYSNGATKDLTALVVWTSSDVTKATVARGGIVAGKVAGTTTMDAYYGSIKSADAVLTVN